MASGTVTAGNDRSGDIAQEDEDDANDQEPGEDERELDVRDRRANGLRPVGQNAYLDRRWNRRLQLRQRRLNPLDRPDDVRARLLQ